jgi:tRNA modification GTPase
MIRNYGDTCPIAAQASQGALALIRISGERCLELLARAFSRPQALLDAPGHSIVHGWIEDPFGASGSGDSPAPIDEALVSVYRAPRSYTGEDSADISSHGGEAAVKAVLETLRKAGFEAALPGEFTFRAFCNGKIDLTRGESVMELVSAKTKQGLEHAVKRLSGALEKEIKAIRDNLLEAVSAAELFLDYPEDEIEGDEAPPYREAAEEALAKLKALAASYNRERLYRKGALAVIAGRPNAGKSSLFNALLNEDRSIVTATPGTTRDWIEASVSIKGIPLRLVDTAGLREPGAADDAEKQGIARSRTLADEADIILYTVDAAAGMNRDDQLFLERSSGKSLIVIWNKIDMIDPAVISRLRGAAQSIASGAVQGVASNAALSAKTGEGIEELCDSIAALLVKKAREDSAAGLGPDSVSDAPSAGLGTRRQKELVEKAASSLEEALAMTEKNEPLDVIAPALRESLNALGEITGEVSSADILEVMFSRFCLGK